MALDSYSAQLGRSCHHFGFDFSNLVEYIGNSNPWNIQNFHRRECVLQTPPFSSSCLSDLTYDPPRCKGCLPIPEEGTTLLPTPTNRDDTVNIRIRLHRTSMSTYKVFYPTCTLHWVGNKAWKRPWNDFMKNS
jgi:hypothetical protein